MNFDALAFSLVVLDIDDVLDRRLMGIPGATVAGIEAPKRHLP